MSASTIDDASLQAELASFFDRYLAAEPEEATTLGVHTYDGAHRDPSREGASARVALYREALTRFEPATRRPDLPPALRHDIASVVALCRFEIHAHDDIDRDVGSVEWSVYPAAMAAYARAQGLDVGPRLAAIPAILAAREECLRDAARTGRLSDRATVAYVASAELPGAAADIAPLDEAAAEAMRAHARFLEASILPHAPVDPSIGEEEYTLRLRFAGIPDAPSSLEEAARSHLAEMQAGILRVASSLAGATFRTMAEAAPLVRELQGARLESDPRALYRRVIDRVVQFSRERGLFDFPPLELGMDDYPAALRGHGPGTNWPAPLLDRDKKGQFVVHPDPAAHPAAWAPILAVHEGVPGHFLQSVAFRETFGESRAPVRFFCVADNVAIPRMYLRSMTSVEGWAVYAEELMRREGLHEGRDMLFAYVAHALRALRVLGDIGLHTRRLEPEAILRMLIEEGGLLESSARGELARYGRLPVQAVTYFVGQRQIGGLAERARAADPKRGPSAFHTWFFQQGPVPPCELTPWE